jgi:hypothetical protein
MSSKNIAFAGAIGTGKSILQMKTIDLLDGKRKTRISNNLPTKILSKTNNKYKTYFKDSEEFDLSCAFSRRIEMLSIDPSYYIVSDEWVLNELAKTMVFIKAIQDKINASAQVINQSGNFIMNEAQGQLVIAQSIFQILINQVSIEKDFWDFLYYVPIFDPGDDILDEEGLQPKDRLYQKEMDIALVTLIQELQLDVVSLPVGIEESFQFLESDSRKWMS